MADLSSFTGKNRRHTGTTGITVSDASGAVPGNRVNGTGRLRFNSDLNLLEYYTGSEWKSIDDWNLWFYSKERSKIFDQYKEIIGNETFDLLNKRMPTDDTFLL